MARLARRTARAWEQSVQAGRTGHGDSAHPSPREREHHGTYYIKSAADDVRSAMSKLESNIPAPKSLTDILGTLNEDSLRSARPVN